MGMGTLNSSGKLFAASPSDAAPGRGAVLVGNLLRVSLTAEVLRRVQRGGLGVNRLRQALLFITVTAIAFAIITVSGVRGNEEVRR